MLKAGAIVGEGGQACVLKPALDGKNNHVTKIESQFSAITETEISYFLSTRDPKGHFGIYSLTKMPNCRINASKIVIDEGALKYRPSKDESKCRDIANRQKDSDGFEKKYCAFSMEAYTHDLDTIPDEPVKAIFRGIINLWDALEFFHSLDVIHGDIKLPNIAYRKKYSGKAEMFAFADWGWSARLKTSKEADDQLRQMLKHRVYAADKEGIWAPYMWDTKARRKYTAKQLLKYNDMYSLALMTADLFRKLLRSKKIRDADVREVLFQLNDLLQYSDKHVGTSVGLAGERIRGLLF